MRVGICGGDLRKQIISTIPDNSLCYGKNAEPSFEWFTGSPEMERCEIIPS
jgi:hypothetical protein